MSRPCFLLTLLMSLALNAIAEAPRLVTSTRENSWVVSTLSAAPKSSVASETWTFSEAHSFQVIDGFGGCFNEKGWSVLNGLTEDEKEKILKALFDPHAGCGFTLGRLPLGANDYSLEWYSFDETPGDFSLNHFSIERDRHTLIPYLRAAKAFAPALRFWASPWCPPSWMKTNGHYAGRPSPRNDLKPEQAGKEMETQFRMEPEVLGAYARYFARFIKAYKDEGIDLYAVHVQNEPNSAQDFPSCVWRPEDLGTFIGKYLGPEFRAQKLATEIWLGTIERPQLERVEAALATESAATYVKGIGFQWAGKDAIPLVHQAHPTLPLIQTESECGDGSNDWAAARHTFGLMNHYLRNGAESYLYWNMILDETGNSRWGWKQNALITVDSATHAVRYNPEFYVLKHFSAFVKKGARRIDILGTDMPALGFLNPDGSRVIVAENEGAGVRHVEIKSNGQTLHVELPGGSFATVIF